MRLNFRTENEWYLQEPPFPFQRTFKTPLPNRAIPEERSNLPRFVEALLTPFELSECEIRTETFVFEPTELIWYLRGLNIIAEFGELNQADFFAENKTEVFALLECVLGQWADFALFASAKGLAIYADHDEWTTIFTETQETLTKVQIAMQREGFTEVDEWSWTCRHPQEKIEEGTHV